MPAAVAAETGARAVGLVQLDVVCDAFEGLSPFEYLSALSEASLLDPAILDVSLPVSGVLATLEFVGLALWPARTADPRLSIVSGHVRD